MPCQGAVYSYQLKQLAEERSDYQLKSGATALRLAALSMGL